MATIKVYNMKGSEVGSMELCDCVFGVEYKEALSQCNRHPNMSQTSTQWVLIISLSSQTKKSHVTTRMAVPAPLTAI